MSDEDDDIKFSEALAQGLALSEQEWIEQQQQVIDDRGAAEQIALQFHQQELRAAVDQEYAQVLELSEHQFTVDATTHKLNQVLNQQSLQS